MKKFFLLFVGVVVFSGLTFAGNYKLDNNSVDNLFESATELAITSVSSVMNGDLASSGLTSISEDTEEQSKVIMNAFILDIFLGGFGVHRHILGTKDNMWAIYTFSCCGIFGIVPTVDFFILLIDGIINKNGSKYMDNENFFMWN